MTTGEIANGRSMTASSRRLPRTLERTSSSAAMIPNAVFSGTAIAAISIVSQNALTAAGVVIESHTAPRPGSKVRYSTTPIGTSSSSAREASAKTRIDRRPTGLAVMAVAPVLDDAQEHQHGQRHGQQHDRHGRRAGRVVA